MLGGMVHGAMYDAVAAIEGGLEPFATGVRASGRLRECSGCAGCTRRPRGPRAGAGGDVRPPSTTTWRRSRTGRRRTAGKAVGAAAAAGMLAMRTGDHFDDSSLRPAASRAGRVRADRRRRRRSTSKLPYVRPFTYETQSEYRPEGPLELTSKRYAKDLAELQAYGRNVGTLRTPSQTETVRFFTEQTFFQFNRTLRELVDTRGARSPRVRQAPRVRERRDRGHDDRLLGGEVPLQLLAPEPCDPAGRHRREPGHVARRDLVPLIVGNHPEYPSGHACFTAAVTQSLHQYFGTKKVLDRGDEHRRPAPPRTYENLDDLVEDVENARVWGGLHFRTTMTETAKHFPRIAREVGKHYFLEGAKRDKGKR